MLTSATKRKIDNARDILVGKIPMPTAQVEQITLALIYKFMSDIDKKSKALGDTSGFFANGYEKYAWDNLMDKSLPARDRVTLYSEGLEKMSKNPHIPQLFRDIFKNAFLPFRSPETLKLFLEQIDEFQYDHSEELGNAFEYLLSVMGSQGDAGQFRTPRHIIDFIVKVVDPSKTDTILDPACGTAGFLISAYKHIREKGLTAEEQKKLTDNFVGYDISHDMQRLAMVNMYLHHFPDPKIFEYDTLSSEDRWDDDFDVILANPPFMTPKGGIKPHSRFSIESKKAEVLFTDYIMGHLNPSGKAGVIVPEGIIFQSQNSHSDLRKMMVDNDYLYAVVSLPSGIFQPYSGVKTSILFFDRQLAKTKNEIIYSEIKNVGISLGISRRLIKQNDIPACISDLQKFVNNDDSGEFDISWVVSKKEIIKNNYDLNPALYKPRKVVSKKFEYKKLSEISKISKGKSSSTKTKSGSYPLILTAESNKSSDHFDFSGVGVAVPLISSLGHGKAEIKRIHQVSGKFALADLLAFIQPRTDIIDSNYLYYVLDGNKIELASLMKGAANVSMKVSDLEGFLIPVPSLEVQRNICKEIEGYKRIIDGASSVVDSYKPQIAIKEDWEWIEIGKICKNLDSERVPIEKGRRKVGKFPYYGASGIVDWVDGYLFDEDLLLISEDGANLLSRSTPIAFSVSGKCWVNNHAHVLKFDDKINQKFVEYFINQIDISSYVTGAAQPKLNQRNLNRILVPNPSYEIKKQIVLAIDEEIDLINSNVRLMKLFNQKIASRIKEIWEND